jgi:hypothetical protein
MNWPHIDLTWLALVPEGCEVKFLDGEAYFISRNAPVRIIPILEIRRQNPKTLAQWLTLGKEVSFK